MTKQGECLYNYGLISKLKIFLIIDSWKINVPYSGFQRHSCLPAVGRRKQACPALDAGNPGQAK